MHVIISLNALLSCGAAYLTVLTSRSNRKEKLSTTMTLLAGLVLHATDPGRATMGQAHQSLMHGNPQPGAS